MGKKLVAMLMAAIMAVGMTACKDSSASAPGAKPAEGKEDTAENAGSKTSDDVFVLGVQQPLSGENAVAGQISVNTIKLYADRANANGGWAGKQINVVAYDDQSSSEEAVKIAEKLIQVDKADVVIGSLLSSNVLASAGYLNDAKIVTLGLGTSPTWMQQDWDYVFRACQSTDLVLPSMVSAMKAYGIKSVAIFHGDDDSSMAGYTPMLDQLKEAGIEVVDEENYTSGDTDFSGQIAAILNKNPDCVYMSTQGPVIGSFLKQLRSFGYEGMVFSKELLTSDQMEVAGSDGDGYIFGSGYVTYADTEECIEEDMKEFYELYYEAYGEYPAHDCAFRAWDSMLVIEEAINIAGEASSEAIYNAIPQVKGIDTLAGIVDYSDGTGEGLHEVNCYVVEGEKYIPISEWDASAYTN